jgi:hypothetical protein
MVTIKHTRVSDAVVSGEALETMVQLFLWPSIILLRKLAMYCDYLVHSTYDRFFCTRSTKEGENRKPTVIPSKSHGVAVFIFHGCSMQSLQSLQLHAIAWECMRLLQHCSNRCNITAIVCNRMQLLRLLQCCMRQI